MYAVCILSVIPHYITVNFAKELSNVNYKVFICLDNENIKTEKCSEIEYIKIKNEECEKLGYFGSVDYCKTRACSRDKALYYFSCLDTKYDYIWFIEEDVFIPYVNTLMNIDEKYTKYDLLSESNVINDGNTAEHWQHWNKNNGKINHPWAKSMVCAVRVSNKLMKCIKYFVTQHQYLLFDEMLFNTIALHNNLQTFCPVELENIIFQFMDLKIKTIKLDNLYHPIRDINVHQCLRENNACFKIIIARYNESINWIKPISKHVILYNKGQSISDLTFNIQKTVTVENIGRESHTYLKYIFDNYETLPNISIFCQGDITDHYVGNPIVNINKMKNEAQFIGISSNWRNDLHVDYNFKIKETTSAKGMKYICSDTGYTFGDWFIKYVNNEFPKQFIWYTGAVFAVRKSNILRRNKQFYETLLKQHKTQNPEVAHFLERSWYYIFN